MVNIEKLVRERRSFRTFDGRELTAEDREKLCAFIETIENPYGLSVEFKFLEKNGLSGGRRYRPVSGSKDEGCPAHERSLRICL